MASTEAYSRKPWYPWYVVAVLTAIYACHTLDRSLPGILIEPIRHEFNLSDSQLGLFSGLAFGVAFSLSVLPMGLVSDRTNRRNCLAVILILWSALTAVAGLARDFTHLLLARIGVGASEAGAAPIAMPMIADIFPAEQRAMALGFFYTASPLGVFFANAVGGYVAAEHGWRAAFFIAGVPGLVLAVLLLTTVRDPRRGGSEIAAAKAEPGEKPPGLRAVLRYLAGQPGLLCVIASCAVFGLILITTAAWMGSFFIRVHGMGLAQTGLILGVGAGLVGIVGPPVYGWAADRLSVRDPRWPLRLVWISALLGLAVSMWMYFTPSLPVAVICFVVSFILTHGYPPPAYATVMTHTPPQMRGTVMSLLQLVTYLAGFGLGPWLTGVLSDYFGGGTAIRYALATVSMLLLVVVGLVLVSIRLLYPPPSKTAGATA